MSKHNETYEEIDFDKEETTNKKPDDFAGMTIGFFSMVHFKQLIIIFFLFLFVSSEVFIDKILTRIDGSTEHKNPTTKGTIIQASFLVLMFMILDILVRYGFP